jgi:hypothetical protein
MFPATLNKSFNVKATIKQTGRNIRGKVWQKIEAWFIYTHNLQSNYPEDGGDIFL